MSLNRSDIYFSNFKCSLKLLHFNGMNTLRSIYVINPTCCKIVNNFLVLRSRWVFIIFSNGFVNVTKIKNLDNDVIEMRQYLTQIIKLQQINFKVENLTGTCILDTKESTFFSKLIKFQGEKTCFIKPTFTTRKKIGLEYDYTSFPAIKIFTNVGVGLIFSNGKLNIVGCKSILDAYWIRNQIQIIIDEFL